VEAPGDYVRVEVASNPVVIVRDKENPLRGLYNVCRPVVKKVPDKGSGTRP